MMNDSSFDADIRERFPAPTESNTSFSTKLPGLQIAIDSTSLGTFKECPRKYYYSIVRGFQPRAESVHLRFGLLVHSAAERYEHAKIDGASHDDALDVAVQFVLESTWDTRLGRAWQSDHKQKNRVSLIRTVVWYLETYGKNDSMQTVQRSNGKPAVELTFRYGSGFVSEYTGEEFLFCGHLDRIVELSDRLFISDIKTTGSQLTPNWFASFTPGNQFSMYALAGKLAFGTEVDGVIVDGAQIGTNFVRFQRQLVPRPKAVLEEWYEMQGAWLQDMETAAAAGQWKMNDKSCGNYGGCPFQSVCSKPQAVRERWLASDFVKRVWDPLVVRGDV